MNDGIAAQGINEKPAPLLANGDEQRAEAGKKPRSGVGDFGV